MRARIAAALVSVTFAATLAAQPPAAGTAYTLGGSLGVTATSFSGRSDEGTRTMPVLGVSVNARTARHSSSSAGLLLSFKGASGRSGGTGHVLTYLELPLVALIEFAEPASSAQFFVGGGLAPALRLRCRELPRPLDSASDQPPEPCDPTARTFDLGLDGRVGFRAAGGAGVVMFELRYVLGLLHVQENIDRRNNSLGVILGYQWRLGQPAR